MDLKKIIQTVNFLLGKYDYRLNYTKLIKMLYLADKEALKLWDAQISGDKYFSMRQGPVLSGLYDLIKEDYHKKLFQLQWNEYFYTDDYDLVSIRKEQVPVGELSEREIHLLNEIDMIYHDWSWQDLIDRKNKKKLYPEWQDPGDSAVSLPIEDILAQLGRSEEEIERFLEEESFFKKEALHLVSRS